MDPNKGARWGGREDPNLGGRALWVGTCRCQGRMAIQSDWVMGLGVRDCMNRCWCVWVGHLAQVLGHL